MVYYPNDSTNLFYNPNYQFQYNQNYSSYPSYSYQQSQPYGSNFNDLCNRLGSLSLLNTKEEVTMQKKQYGVVCIGGGLISAYDTLEEAESSAARLASNNDYEYAVIKQIKIFRKKPVDVEIIEVNS